MANVRIWCTDITISLHNLVVWGFYNKPLATTDLNNNRGYIITVGFAEAGASLVIDRGTPEWWFKWTEHFNDYPRIISFVTIAVWLYAISNYLKAWLRPQGLKLGAWSLELGAWSSKNKTAASDNLWWSNPFVSVSYKQSFRRALIIIEQLKLHILGTATVRMTFFNFFWKTQTHMQYASHSSFRCLAYLSWS